MRFVGVFGAISASGAVLSAAVGGTQRPTPVPVKLLAVGDLMLGGAALPTLRKHGTEYLFRDCRKSLKSTDLLFGNLETPLSEGGKPTPGKSAESIRKRKNFVFRAPTAAAAGLARVGFDVVSIANNHTMDYGGSALRTTLESLASAGVAAVGGGMNLGAARTPVYLRRNGQRFAFLAISDVLPALSVAGKSRPGVAPARGEGFAKAMKEGIQAARKQADWVLVSVHWGKELYTGATSRQRTLGRQLIDWGADAVIGHHTHVLGPVERYRGRWIHYSLGNFIGTRRVAGGSTAWELTFTPGRSVSQKEIRLVAGPD